MQGTCSTLGEALSELRTANGLVADGERATHWYPGEGLIHVRLPNFGWRKRALARHDAHHLLTGYACTRAGEMEMAAWEFAAGRYPHVGATLFCLPPVGMGLRGAGAALARADARALPFHVRAGGNAMKDPYKVNSLVLGPGVNPVHGHVRWDPVRSLWNASMVLGALVLAPLYFSWSAFAVFLVFTGVTLCIGHSVGFHRRLVHRSFQCPKWVERTLVWAGSIVGMGGPIWTIRTHDMRDWAQRQSDCHDFLAHRHGLLKDGWWNLHCRLVLDTPPGFDPGPGIGDDPFHVFMEKTWKWHQLPVAAILYYFGGMPWLAWGVFARVAACTTMHWFISYFAHTRGPQSWLVDGAGIQAHDVPLAAIPTMGESWHNNHHAFPGSARHGLYPGQHDWGYRFIQVLEFLGLAWNVQLPSNLPPRPGITPVRPDAASIAAPGQVNAATSA